MKSEKKAEKKIETVSKIESLLDKKQIKFCKKIGLSIRPNAREGALMSFIKSKGMKVGKTIDFRKVQGMKNALGRKERRFLNSFYKIDVEPVTYSPKFDKEGKRNGVNFKKIETGKVVKI